MSKNQKRFQIWYVCGDQHGDTCTRLYTDDCGCIAYEANNGFVKGVQPTKSTSVFNRLSSYLTQGDYASFEALLKTDFIYPGMISSYRTDNDHSQGEWEDYAYETYHTRPNVEALFTEDFDSFVKLVNLLREKNDESFYEAFKNSLANTSLANASLFEWNTDIQQRISDEITDLQTYGTTLSGATTLLGKRDASANTRGDQIGTLMQVLDTPVKGRKTEESKTTTNKEKFENLQFKLQLVRDLHQKDSAFESHRGWKRFAVNFVTILFSAGIANLLFQKCPTGNWLFFNKTTTQEKISNIHAAIGFDPNDEIHFNAKNELKI